MGLSGYGFQYTLLESIRLEKNTNILAIISSMSILITYLFETLIIGTPFTWTASLGSLLVCASVSFIMVYHRQN